MKTGVIYISFFFGLCLLVIMVFDSFIMPSYVRMNSGRYMVNVIDKNIDYAKKILVSEGYRSLISDTLFSSAYETGTVVD